MDSNTIDHLQEQLIKLPFTRQLAFFWFLGQRLYPNYVALYKQTQWGEPEILQKAAAYFMETIDNNGIIENEPAFLSKALAKASPDTEDFEDFVASLALDACAVWQEGLDYIEDRNTEHLITVSTSAIDMVQMFIEYQEETDYDDYAWDNPLLKEEIRFQQNVIDTLKSMEDINEATLRATSISYSALGAKLTSSSINDLLPPKKHYHWQTLTFPLDEELQDWLRAKNISIDELVPELLHHFYQTLKKVDQ